MDKEFTERRRVWRRIGSAEEMQESMIKFYEVSIRASDAEVSAAHRMSGWAITCDDFRSFDADALEHACRVRDELLAIQHDWTAADPRRDASDETMGAVRAVWARERARRGEP